MAKPTIPHLDWPVRFGSSGHLAANEQDSIDDIASCVAVSLMTPRGWRADEPQFGSRPDFPLLPYDFGSLAGKIQQDEPRAALDVLGDQGAADLMLRIQVRVGGTGTT